MLSLNAFPEICDGSNTTGAFPGEKNTLQRLKLWLLLLHEYFEKVLQSLKQQISPESNVFLPRYPLKRQTNGWLRCLVRYTVNIGASQSRPGSSGREYQSLCP